MSMNWKSVGGVVAKLAPTIGAAVGGPLGGAAISSLESALGITKAGDLNARQDAVAGAIGAASPEQLLQLQLAEKDFGAKMAQLGFADAEALASLSDSDRASARLRESTLRDSTPHVLALGVTVGFFGLLLFMAMHEVPATSKDVLNIMIGSLGAGWVAIISYYFGSSTTQAQTATLTAVKS